MMLHYAILGVLLLLMPAAHAQQYPSKPIRLIVPYTPGGGTDVTARLVAMPLSQLLGQPIVIDNRPGGGGTLAADMTAKSLPDGYTLFLGSPGPLAVNPVLMAKIPYDVQKDFQPVTQIIRSPLVLVVNNGVPVQSVKDLIALAKAKPGTLNFASSGNGTIEQLGAELFKAMTGVDMTHVPYRGTAPAMADLFGGRVQLMFANLPPVIAHIRGSKIRGLAVGGAARSASLPELPTISESGAPGYEAGSWFGFVLPARTPRAIVDRLYRDTAMVVRSTALQEKFAGLGAEPVANTPEEFQVFLRAKLQEVTKVAKFSGMRLE
jgi:tripartite-type tricarboxylate transporter receptor subunit TctC